MEAILVLHVLAWLMIYAVRMHLGRRGGGGGEGGGGQREGGGSVSTRSHLSITFHNHSAPIECRFKQQLTQLSKK